MKKEREQQTPRKSRKASMNYFENLYSNKLENLEVMDRFIDLYDHSKLNKEDINNLYRKQQ
jgi:hypothetical protein